MTKTQPSRPTVFAGEAQTYSDVIRQLGGQPLRLDASALTAAGTNLLDPTKALDTRSSKEALS